MDCAEKILVAISAWTKSAMPETSRIAARTTSTKPTTTVTTSCACSSTKIDPVMPRGPGRGGRPRPRGGSDRSPAASSTGGGYTAPGTVQTAPRSAPDTSAAYLAMAPLV